MISKLNVSLFSAMLFAIGCGPTTAPGSTGTTGIVALVTGGAGGTGQPTSVGATNGSPTANGAATGNGDGTTGNAAGNTGGNGNTAGNGNTGGNGNTVGATAASTAGAASTTGAGSTTGAASTTGSSDSCPGYAAPNTAASCTCGSGETCELNNCYGGWYCKLSDNKCVAPPTNCAGTTSATTGTTGAFSTSIGSTSTTTNGATTSSGSGGSSGWTGAVTAQGGSVSSLFFAAVGDTRPPDLDQNSEYPTQIITTIFQDIQQQNAQFVISTGDYQYATPTTTNGQTQIGYYETAKAGYSGVEFPAMGNHECDGYTADNCDTSGNISSGGSGSSNNYAAFKSQMLAPIGQSLPYYSININGTDGSWTSKFIFIACNAWDSTQSSWLTSALAPSTTYTFVMQHEDASATTAPCYSDVNNILSGATYTLKIVGHAHEYQWADAPKEVIVGNGGADLSSGSYGYALIQQLPSGEIQVSNMDYSSNAALSVNTIAAQ